MKYKTYKKYKIMMFVVALIFFTILNSFVSALQTTPISYIEKVAYTPYCGTTCTNNTVYNSTSNITTITNNCQTGCHAIFNISLMFAGDDEFRSVQINTSSPLYQNGSDFIIPGVYMATLGNNSDVTGINEKILNLTGIINNNLAACYSDNLGLKDNHSRENLLCTQEKDSLNSAISQRNNTITEYEKYKNQRWWFGIGGIVLGFIIIKWFLPYTKEHIPKRDPIESQHSPYLGQH